MQYGKFVDAVGKVASQLKFLSKAVSDDKIRYFMNFIHIEQSDKGEGLLGVATDGHHLHLVDPLHEAAVEAFGITPGYWKALRFKKKKERIWIARLDDLCVKDRKYPDWRKIIPCGEAVYKTAFEGFSLTGPKAIYSEFAKFIHGFPDVTAINLEYLQALGTGFTWDAEWYGPNKALKFTEGDRTALIMPMRID